MFRRVAWAAWHVAAFSRQKKLMALDDFLPTRKPVSVGDKLKGFLLQFRRKPKAKDGDGTADSPSAG